MKRDLKDDLRYLQACMPATKNYYDMRTIAEHAIERAMKAENILDRYYAGTERLWQWARENLTGDLANQFWEIASNGYLMTENPEYHQRLNYLKHEAEGKQL